jgi:hypothetical protein
MRELTEFERGYFAAALAAAGRVYVRERRDRRSSIQKRVEVSSNDPALPRAVRRMVCAGRMVTRINRLKLTTRFIWLVQRNRELVPVLRLVAELSPRHATRARLLLGFLQESALRGRREALSIRQAAMVKEMLRARG